MWKTVKSVLILGKTLVQSAHRETGWGSELETSNGRALQGFSVSGMSGF